MKKLTLFACCILAACQSATRTIEVVDLRVDYETTPMTVESGQPQFSWRMESDDGQGSQRAYAVEVFAQDGSSVWASGEVESASSTGIRYSGPALEPTQRYSWQVTVWPEDGDVSTAQSWFETGFLSGGVSSWHGAEWIGGSDVDRVFQSDYLSVFRLAYDVQIDQDSGSERAAFLLGGNDFRLMDANLNVHSVENAEDESFIALELDISGFDSGSGRARLHVYRVGHTQEDRRDEPFASFDVPTSIIGLENRYDAHRIHVDAIFGVLAIWVDGRDADHRLTPYDAFRSQFQAQGLEVSPLGSGGNYIAFPMVGEIGFWQKPGQQARFSNIDVSNLRAPANTLFAAGGESAYDEIFAGEGTVRIDDDGGYVVRGGDDATVVLADPSRPGTPMLRTEFSLDDKMIASARIYVTARGIYELYLNGTRVGDDVFAPGLTQYDKHHPYQAYDVTEQLQSGDANALGATLSEGWWSGNATYTGGNWNFFGDRQSLLAALVVTYEDGTTQEIVTDASTWRVSHNGPVRYGSFFQGEVYDARLEDAVDGWTEPGYDDGGWQPAATVPLDGSAFVGDPARDRDIHDQLITSWDESRLVGHDGESPSVVDTLNARSVEETRPGVYVYDMGQNMVGFPRIRLSGTAPGTRVVIRYAEVLYPELSEHEGLERTPMMENLRAALNHDVYVTKGGTETIEPRFTFHGFRYLEISGLASAPPVDAVEGLVVSSVDSFSAHYETSNPTVNRLWDNIRWSMRGNFLSIPTDTPARNERMGWSGDISVFARTANYMSHVNPFMTRHMLAMRDLQSDAGRFPDVAPVGGGFGGTLWGSAGVTVAWETYRQYGDLSLLADHYAAMVRYVEYLQTRRDPQHGMILEGPLGDWLSPENAKNDNTLLWEAYNVYLLDIVAQAAAALGNEADAERFNQMRADSKAYFVDTYIDEESGRTISSGLVQQAFGPPPAFDPDTRGTLVDTQASYAIPIALGVLDGEERERAARHLAEAVERENTDDRGVERPAYSLMTGFIGTAAVGDALSMTGRDDLAYRLLQQTSYPSWLYPVLNGATTIWERLNSYTVDEGFGGNNSMNSFNHYAFGAVGGWMMSRSLGIRPGDEPGYASFVLAPTPDPTGQMTWAKGHYDSLYGRIESEWSVEDDGSVKYRFVVPENSNADVVLPTGNNASIENGQGLEQIEMRAATVLFRAPPGTHEVTVRVP